MSTNYDWDYHYPLQVMRVVPEHLDPKGYINMTLPPGTWSIQSHGIVYLPTVNSGAGRALTFIPWSQIYLVEQMRGKQ